MKNMFFLLILTIVFSCDTSVKESQSLTELRVKKASLIEQMDRIGTELKDIEMAISELDTLKPVSKAIDVFVPMLIRYPIPNGKLMPFNL